MKRLLKALWAWLTAPVEALPPIDVHALEQIVEPGRYRVGPYRVNYFGEVEYGTMDVSVGERLAPIARVPAYFEISRNGRLLYRYSPLGGFCEWINEEWGPWQPGTPSIFNQKDDNCDIS